MEEADKTARRVYWISDEAMSKHKCEWDEEHIETPRRLQCLLCLIEDESSTSVLKECEILQPSIASVDEIRLVHSEAHIEAVSKTAHMNLEELEDYCSGLEDVYANKHTYDSCMRSAGCALAAMRSVIADPCRFACAFAAIRPPGHHASRDTACGFCLFNNVAICAKKARESGVERVLIVDWDVHAAQGTQYCIRNESGIKLISVHRFQHGTFWPNLPESSIHHSYENTVNVTLNETGLGDAEYVTLIQHLVAPIIADFQPGLILVSCGFDAALGDPEGEMRVTPAGFHWMTRLLVQQALKLEAPLCMLLEGGYFVHTLPQNVEACVKAMMSKPPPQITIERANDIFLDSFHTAAIRYGTQYPRLQLFTDVVKRIRRLKGVQQVKVISADCEYKGVREFSLPYETRGNYVGQSRDQVKDFLRQLDDINDFYRQQSSSKRKATLYVNEVNEETDENVFINIEHCADEAVTREFLQMHVCDGVEGISMARDEVSKKKSCSDITHSALEGAVHQATVNSICTALLKLFDKGLAHHLQHLLTGQ